MGAGADGARGMRCALCHGQVRITRAASACPRCGTRLHNDCARALGRCPTLFCAGAPRRDPDALAELRPRRRRGGPDLPVLLLVIAAGLVVGGIVGFRARDPEPAPVATAPPPLAPPVLVLDEPARRTLEAAVASASAVLFVSAPRGSAPHASAERALLQLGRAALPALRALERGESSADLLAQLVHEAGLRAPGPRRGGGLTDAITREVRELPGVWRALEHPDALVRRAALDLLEREVPSPPVVDERGDLLVAEAEPPSNAALALLARRCEPESEPEPALRLVALDLLVRLVGLDRAAHHQLQAGWRRPAREAIAHALDDPDPRVEALAIAWFPVNRWRADG